MNNEERWKWHVAYMRANGVDVQELFPYRNVDGYVWAYPGRRMIPYHKDPWTGPELLDKPDFAALKELMLG